MLSRRDIPNGATADPDKPRHQSLLVAAKGPATELVLFTYTPAPDAAGSIECECVVLSTDNLGDFLEAWNEDGILLDFNKISTDIAELLVALGILLEPQLVP